MVPDLSTDPQGFLSAALDALKDKHWPALAALVLVAALYAVRRWALPAALKRDPTRSRPWSRFLAGDAFGSLLAAVLAAGLAVAGRLAVGEPLSLGVLVDAAKVALPMVVWHLLPDPQAKSPSAPPVPPPGVFPDKG